MTIRHADYNPRNMNNYVPACTYAADVVHSGPTRIDLGTPTVANAAGILNDELADDTGPFTYRPGDGNFLTVSGFNGATGEITDAPFGRDITMVASGANTPNVTIVGRDYLGQPVKKTKAMNGTTPVTFGVAYKWIDSITVAAGTASRTIDVGFGDALGLPYKTIKVLSEELDLVVVSSLGTLTSPVVTDPATVSTGDPRGLYDPQSTLTGAARLTITAICSADVNASGNGGLHGIKHYFA